MQNKPYHLWPGEDDTQAIEAMLNKQHPLYEHHWMGCQMYIYKMVQIQADNFSQEVKEEISQNILLRVIRSLETFKQKSRLTTWITKIGFNCIADAGREQRASMKQEEQPIRNSNDEDDEEDLISRIRFPRTTEDTCIYRENIREIKEKVREYLSKQRNQERTIHIFDMYLDGLSQEEIARSLDMPAANVGYAIRSMKKLFHKQD